MRNCGDRNRFIASLAASAASGVAALALGGPTFEEIPDAGSLPSSGQPVTGPPGGVGRIKGALNGIANSESVDFEDVYIINIVDPIGFKAIVDATGTTFDTQLWLFKLPGNGLLSNDNDPISFPTIFSRIQPPATDGTGQIIPGPGLYLLAISSKQNTPSSPFGPIFQDASFNGTEISGPDGAGGPGQLTNWSHSPGTVGGDYVINLTGVDFLELPCDVICPPSAAQDFDAFECNGDSFDPNGGCNYPGNPLQNLGTLSPTSYRAACGTTGTVLPDERDRDCYRFHLDQPAFVSATLVNNLPGKGTSAPNIELIVLRGDQCATQDVVYDVVSPACPLHSGPIDLPAGDHVVIVTVGAVAPGGPPCPVEYLLWLTAKSGANPECGDPSIGLCGAPHPEPGCNDLSCCETVCAIDVFCCDVTWDLICANQALAMCLEPPYSCVPGRGPVNDCATNAITLPLDSTTSFSTLAATTDGPTADADACTPGKDLWYRVQVPAMGKLRISTCDGTDFDSTIEVYELGTSPIVDPTSVFDGTHLIGCDDDGCGLIGGPSLLEVRTPWPDPYVYLIRVGGYINAGIPAAGNGTLTVSFAHLIYTTGPTHKLRYDALNGGNLVPTNLGLSSGKLSPTQPQRWCAQAFNVPTGPLGGYRITEIHGYGFSPAGATNQTLNFIVWKRTAFNKPVNGDQLATGAVPFPVPTDLPEGEPANEDHLIALPAGPVVAAGNYWLTLYADNSDGPGVVANFGWFIGADDGINVLGSRSDGSAFAWRSAMFPLPGFLNFTLPRSTLQQLPGYDPNDLYNAGFTLCGVPVVPLPPCPADLDGNGFVNGADLATLLGAWGTSGPGNIDTIGVVDGADLAILLGAWGPC